MAVTTELVLELTLATLESCMDYVHTTQAFIQDFFLGGKSQGAPPLYETLPQTDLCVFLGGTMDIHVSQYTLGECLGARGSQLVHLARYTAKALRVSH